MTKAELLAYHVDGHSQWQIEHAMIASNGFGTTYGRFRQALRELAAREDIIAEQGDAIEDATMELARQERRYRWHLAWNRARLAVDIRRNRRRLEHQRRRLADTEREQAIIYAECQRYAAELGDLSQDRIAELDREMWHHYWRMRLVAEMLVHRGAVTPGFLVEVAKLPDDLRRDLSGIAKRRDDVDALAREMRLLP